MVDEGRHLGEVFVEQRWPVPRTQGVDAGASATVQWCSPGEAHTLRAVLRMATLTASLGQTRVDQNPDSVGLQPKIARIAGRRLRELP